MGVLGEILAHRSQFQQQCEREAVARRLWVSSGEVKGVDLGVILVLIFMNINEFRSVLKHFRMDLYLFLFSQAQMWENACFLKWPTMRIHSK